MIALLTSTDSAVLASKCFEQEPRVILSENELSRIPDGSTLIGFNTGVIVPRSVLDRMRTAVNFHAAPPWHPGRDPHHWAIYEDSGKYGCTLHKMVERVDEGEIYETDVFNIPKPIHPVDLYGLAFFRMLKMLKRTLPMIFSGTLKPNGERWSGRKRTRTEFFEMCRIDLVDGKERERRVRAFSHPSKNNFPIEVEKPELGDWLVGSPD